MCFKNKMNKRMLGFTMLCLTLWDSEKQWQKWFLKRGIMVQNICKNIAENGLTNQTEAATYFSFHKKFWCDWSDNVFFWCFKSYTYTFLKMINKCLLKPLNFYIWQRWPTGSFFIDYSSRVLVLYLFYA